MKAEIGWLGARGLAVALLAGVTALSGCGDSRSTPGSVAFDRLGAECGDVRRVQSSEVEVDDADPACGDGYCLHSPDVARGDRESPGMCSCRCDGEAGTGPFCACSEGFVCREEVRALGLSPPALTGSYCVPMP